LLVRRGFRNTNRVHQSATHPRTPL
jgi:hypothetical protein